MDQPAPGRSGQHGPGGTAALDHPERATSTTRQAAAGDALIGDARTGDARTDDALTSGQATGEAATGDAGTGQAMAAGTHTGSPEARTSRAARRSVQGIASRPAVQHLGLLIGYIFAGI